MNSVAVSQFRANLVKVLDDIRQGNRIELTSHGKPIAQIIPINETRLKANEALFELSKTAEIRDIISPIDENWDVLHDNS